MKYKQKKEIFKCKFWNQMKNKKDEKTLNLNIELRSS